MSRPQSNSEIPQVLEGARQLLRARRFTEGEAIVAEVLAVQPDCAEAHLLLGMSALQYQPNVAVPHFQRGLRVAGGPLGATLHNNLSYAYALMRRFDEALDAARQALAIRPDYPEALHNLAIALSEKNQIAAALTLRSGRWRCVPPCRRRWRLGGASIKRSGATTWPPVALTVRFRRIRTISRPRSAGFCWLCTPIRRRRT